jgi:hypothetical protein
MCQNIYHGIFLSNIYFFLALETKFRTHLNKSGKGELLNIVPVTSMALFAVY